MTELDRIAKARLITEAALELKAEDPVVLDMREVSSFADTFLVVSGRSDRHVRSVADAVIHAIRDAGEELLGHEGLDDGRWVLIDANDVVIHVFDPEAREHFDLERLWADATRLDLAADLGIEGEALAEPA
jgi:ribosome-associated protein